VVTDLVRNAPPKPSRLARDVAKWERQERRQKQRTKEQRAADAAWSAISAQVRARDRGVCRICTCQTTKAGVGNPRFYGGAHHIVYRSAGGSDDLSNLVWICNQCSEDEHLHRIDITGTSDDLHFAGTPTHIAEARRPVVPIKEQRWP
jgi:5-methylcytosine-specific restriction endonuclease McrA